jgi:hypothetical protein
MRAFSWSSTGGDWQQIAGFDDASMATRFMRACNGRRRKNPSRARQSTVFPAGLLAGAGPFFRLWPEG